MSKKPNPDGATQAFKRFKPRKKVEYIAFVGELDGQTLYEVWYQEDGDYVVSFVTHDAASGFGFVDSISELVHQASSNRRALELRVQLAREGRLELWVASAAFLISLGTLLFLSAAQSGGPQSGALIAAVVGVVASGAVFFFGIWVPSGTRAGVVKPPADPAPQPQPQSP